MKKILALGLCICMTAAVSACGSGQGKTAAGTVPAQAVVEKTAEGSGGETGTPDGNAEGAGAAGETGRGDGRSAEMDAPVQTEPLLVYLNDFDGVIGICSKRQLGTMWRWWPETARRPCPELRRRRAIPSGMWCGLILCMTCTICPGMEAC